MIEKISRIDFIDRFNSMRPDNFTYEGLIALFDYLEELEESMDKPIELDVIALCCEYSEYENLKELQNNYDHIKSMEALSDETTVIYINGDKTGESGFIIRDF